MKFGDTLRQRSVPAWHTHDVDYRDIKHFIKVNTSPGKTKAVSIPNAKETNTAQFEDTLFDILKEQDDRITWFVRSKVGEIQRRLAHLEQQIARFQRRRDNLTVPGHTPVKRLQQYGKIETDILKVGEEIQALSRFIGVQVEAFRKLIKKYKKWTGSSELGYRFDDQVRKKGSSFANTDLKPFLEQYEELLHAVRTLYETSQGSNNVGSQTPHKTWPDRSTTTADARLTHARFILEKGKKVDFDHLIATMKVGSHGKNAVYWVHPENIVELQVLLLQYTRSFNTMSRQGSTTSIHSSRAGSPTVAYPRPGQPDSFNIIVDDARHYLSKQAAETIKSKETSPDASIQRAALHARGNVRDEVSIISWLKDPQHDVKQLDSCAVKRKFVDNILNRGGPILARKASIPHLLDEEPESDPSEAVDRLQSWLKDHPEVAPICSVLSQKARFYTFAGQTAGATLATLDQSISFQKGAWTESDGWPASRFPHAVLRIRQEGAQSVDLIRVLDNSHLTERVHGFSLEHHAIWQATRPKDVSPPFWVPLLDQDLRKIPRAPSSTLQKPSTEFGSQSTTPQMSTATSSEAGGLSTDPRLGKGKGNATFTEDELSVSRMLARSRKHNSDSPIAPPQQYWNEYDNPSDEEDGYVIYLDPNERSFIDHAWARFTSLFKSTEKPGAVKEETRPLLYGTDLESGSAGYESSSSDDEDDEHYHNHGLPPSAHRKHSGYGRVASAEHHQSHAAKAKAAVMSVPTFSMTCFVASLSLLLVGFLLAVSGRKKLVAQVDAGVIFAVVASVLFAVGGVASLYRGGEHLRGGVWAAAGVVLTLVAVGGGGLIAWLTI